MPWQAHWNQSAECRVQSVKNQDADWLHVGHTNPHNYSHREFSHCIPSDNSSASSAVLIDWVGLTHPRALGARRCKVTRKMAEMTSPEPKKRRTGDDLPSTAATNRFSGKVAIVTGGASGRSQLPVSLKNLFSAFILHMGGVPPTWPRPGKPKGVACETRPGSLMHTESAHFLSP